MYKIYLQNFGYFIDGTFETIEAAKARCRKACFETIIYHGDRAVGSWSPIGGFTIML
jgi:hypothetical protein